MFDFWNVRFCFPFTRNSQIFALLYGPLTLPAELRAHMFYFWNVRFCFSFTRNSQIFALLYGPLAPPAELRAHMFCFWNVRFCFPFTRNSQIFALFYGPLALPAELRAHVRFLERSFLLPACPKFTDFLRCFAGHSPSQLSYEPKSFATDLLYQKKKICKEGIAISSNIFWRDPPAAGPSKNLLILCPGPQPWPPGCWHSPIDGRWPPYHRW